MIRIAVCAAFVSVVLGASAGVARAQERVQIKTRDGKSHVGHVVKEIDGGLLFQSDGGSTYAIKLADLEDVQILGPGAAGAAGDVAPQPRPPAPVAPVTVVLPDKAPPPYKEGYKSAVGALFMSLVLPGAGQVYAGEWEWGAAYFGESLVFALGFIWGGVAAYDACEVERAIGDYYYTECPRGLIVAGAVLLPATAIASAVHAYFQVNAGNDRIKRRWCDKHPGTPECAPEPEFQGLNYVPIRSGVQTFHAVTGTWTF